MRVSEPLIIESAGLIVSETMLVMKTMIRNPFSIVISLVLWLCLGGSLASAVGSESKNYAQAIEQAKLATVGILQGASAKAGEPEYGASVKVRGTGIHLGDGVILTARHAVERSEVGKRVVPKEIHVLTDSLRQVSAIRLGANAYLDVAVYRLQGDRSDWPISDVHFAQQDATYGDEVFAVGYPMGRGPALSFGQVGNPNTFLSTVQSRLLQVDLSACRGNSGGGLLNYDGQLVGLVHAIIQTEGLETERGCSRFGFALPGMLVKRVVDAVLTGKAPGFSVLGIHLKTLKDGNHWVLGVAKATGPSRHAGFKKGDILVAIDELNITSASQLKNYLLERTTPGQIVALLVQRGDTQRTISVKLGKS